MTEKTEADLLPWIFAGVVAVIVAVGLVVASINSEALGPYSPAIRSAPKPLGAIAIPAASNLVTSKATITVGITRRVWECAENGQKTFADAPCGVGSTVRELSPVNRMNPTPAPPPDAHYANPPDAGYAPTDEPQYANESTSTEGTCEALDAEFKAINERMRHRYTNPEGEYYRDRLHKISDRKYDLHCDR